MTTRLLLQRYTTTTTMNTRIRTCYTKSTNLQSLYKRSITSTQTIHSNHQYQHHKSRQQSWNRTAYIAAGSVLLVGTAALLMPLQSVQADSIVTIAPTPMFLPPISEIPVKLVVTESFLTRLWKRVSFISRTLLRLPVLGFIWTPLVVSYLFLPKSLWYAYFRRVLEWSGPVFVKFGQWASTRPDVFSDEFVDALQSLQSAVHSHAYSYTKELCERTFGTLGSHRLIVDEKLIGSGSMAQVHHGRVLDSNGKYVDVAVKILHPNTPSRIETDLFIMRCGAALLKMMPGNEFLSLPETIEQFQSLIEQHTDLTGEAHNLDRFRNNFASWSNLHFPSPVWAFVSDKILVETLENGIPLNEFLKLAAPSDSSDPVVDTSTNPPPFYNAVSGVSTSLDPSHAGASQAVVSSPPSRDARIDAHNQYLARLGMRMFLKMMIDDNFIHSDLHPGNLIVNLKPQYRQQLAATKGNAPLTMDDVLSLPPDAMSLTVIDTALVTELDERNRENFLSLFGAIVEGDGILAARLMRENARIEHVTDVAAYEKEMNDLVKQVPEMNLKQTDIGQLLQKCLNIVRQHRVKIESDFASLVMSLIVVEGVGRKLEPQMSIVKESIPVLLKNSNARKILWEKCGYHVVNSMTLRAALS